MDVCTAGAGAPKPAKLNGAGVVAAGAPNPKAPPEAAAGVAPKPPKLAAAGAEGAAPPNSDG